MAGIKVTPLNLQTAARNAKNAAKVAKNMLNGKPANAKGMKK